MRKTLRSVVFVWLALVVGGTPVRAQSAASPDARSAIQQAAAQQRSAIAGMQESLEKQRASVQQQPSQRAASGFFVLSPPATLGTPPPAGMSPSECDPLASSTIDTLVGETAKRENVDEQLLRSVMQRESAFRPCVVSSKGAMGLMQLMPATAERFGVKSPFDPAENVGAGAKLLRELLTRYNGDLRLTLGAYNAGPSAVDTAEGIPPFRETIDYITTILSLLPLKH